MSENIPAHNSGVWLLPRNKGELTLVNCPVQFGYSGAHAAVHLLGNINKKGRADP